MKFHIGIYKIRTVCLTKLDFKIPYQPVAHRSSSQYKFVIHLPPTLHNISPVSWTSSYRNFDQLLEF